MRSAKAQISALLARITAVVPSEGIADVRELTIPRHPLSLWEYFKQAK